MNIVHERKAGTATVWVTGVVDSVSAPALEQYLTALLDDGVKDLLVDLKKTEYLSSAGIRILLRVGRRLEGIGGRLQFAGMSEMVRDVFRTTGIDKVYPQICEKGS